MFKYAYPITQDKELEQINSLIYLHLMKLGFRNTRDGTFHFKNILKVSLLIHINYIICFICSSRQLFFTDCGPGKAKRWTSIQYTHWPVHPVSYKAHRNQYKSFY